MLCLNNKKSDKKDIRKAQKHNRNRNYKHADYTNTEIQQTPSVQKTELAKFSHKMKTEQS